MNTDSVGKDWTDRRISVKHMHTMLSSYCCCSKKDQGLVSRAEAVKKVIYEGAVICRFLLGLHMQGNVKTAS